MANAGAKRSTARRTATRRGARASARRRPAWSAKKKARSSRPAARRKKSSTRTATKKKTTAEKEKKKTAPQKTRRTPASTVATRKRPAPRAAAAPTTAPKQAATEPPVETTFVREPGPGWWSASPQRPSPASRAAAATRRGQPLYAQAKPDVERAQERRSIWPIAAPVQPADPASTESGDPVPEPATRMDPDPMIEDAPGPPQTPPPLLEAAEPDALPEAAAVPQDVVMPEDVAEPSDPETAADAPQPDGLTGESGMDAVQLEPHEGADAMDQLEAGDATLEEMLHELDEALAEDVDNLLRGAYESVEDVLGSIDEPSAEIAGDTGELGVDEELAVSTIDVAAAGDELSSGLLGPSESPEMPTPVDDEPSDDVDAEPEAAEAETPSDPLPEAPEADGPSAPRPARGMVSAKVAAAAGKPRRDADKTPAMTRHAISVLRWMNLPLRFLPPSARVVIDWIALSLVFWVPIVWLIALLVIGR